MAEILPFKQALSTIEEATGLEGKAHALQDSFGSRAAGVLDGEAEVIDLGERENEAGQTVRSFEVKAQAPELVGAETRESVSAVIDISPETGQHGYSSFERQAA